MSLRDGVGGAVVAAAAIAAAVGAAQVHVETGGTERGENGAVVGHPNGGLETIFINEDVRLGSEGVRGLGRIVALDGDLAKGGVVVALLLDILAVPVDLTTGPGDGSGGVARLTSGPQGQLHAHGRLGVHVAITGFVPGGRALESALDFTVHGPGDGLGLPVDGVLVPLIEGVAAGHGGVGAIVVWIESASPWLTGECGKREEKKKYVQSSTPWK